MTRPAHGQASYRIRMEWALDGAMAVVADARPGDVAVVVDVLSFTTTVAVALEQGVRLYPYPWHRDDAQAYADERQAVLAVGRRAALETGGVSLSPVSFLEHPVDRVVLPSPNGSAISFALAEAGLTVVAASVRNATAVAGWLRERADATVSVVAAGEQWPDGRLRPAVEDLWGAGAVLAALGPDGASPEARMAAAAFTAVADAVADELADCAGGRELIEDGFAGDVALAAAYDVGQVVPLLDGDAFVDAWS